MRTLILLFLIYAALTPILAQDFTKTTHIYSGKEGELLKLDVYQNAKDKGTKKPAVLWVHGGGFSGGSRDGYQTTRLMDTLVDHGFVAISMSYRLLRKGKQNGFGCYCPKSEKVKVFQESAKDVWDAYQYIVERYDIFGIDTNQIVLGGSSAGAEAILNAVYMRNWVSDEGAPRRFRPCAVWSQAGAIVDVRYLAEDNNVPGIFFHGVEDNLVPYASAPHHYCKSDQPGYIWLDGPKTITKYLQKHQKSFLMYTYPSGKHEIAGIQWEYLGEVISFLKKTVFHKKLEQRHVVVTK